MSFTLKSIELKNIRAHEYFLFEPAEEGITAISGDNGAGKSTVVDSFAWALYGTRPTGVKNKNLIKDGVDPKDDEVSVKAVIVIGDIEYSIERKIINSTGTVECNVWGKKPGKAEFTQVAGPSVTHVEKFIKSELGMNEKGFLTSIFVQQKQVDQIVSATPRERGAVIEDLTGIASITQAIAKTNENTRSLEKAISIFQVGDIDEAKEKVSNQEKVCEDLSKKKEKASKLFVETKDKYKEVNEEFLVEKAKVNKRLKLSNKMENLASQVDFLEKQSEDDLKYIKEFEEKYGKDVKADTSKHRQAAQNKRTEGYDLKNKAKETKKEISKLEKEIKECEELKGNFKNKTEAKKELTSLTKRLKKVEEDLEKSKERKSMLASELKHSKESHNHIDGEDKTCPVCKSAIENPEELRKQIEEEIQSFKNEQKENKEQITELTKEKKSLSAEIIDVENSVEAIEKSKELSDKLKKAKAEMKDLKNRNVEVEKELKEAEEKYSHALKIEADKSALESARERSLTVNKRIKDSNAEKEKINNEIKELESLTDSELDDLESKASQLKDRLTKLSISGKELVGRSELELERLEDAKVRLEEIEKAVEKYNDISDQIEVSSSASTMLSAFKADRIEHSIPTLEFYASDFLSKFTGGDFTKLSMDEKFNTFVTTVKSKVRPVAQLSGGELSSAAIALRLGISMLLNSSDNNVLILDEVLVSMDEDRSRQIMETISSMTNSQIIFIAHNTDINAVADKTVLVSKAPGSK